MLSSAMRTCFMSWSHAPMRYALIYSSHLVILVHACHEVFKCVFFLGVSDGQCTCNHPTTTKSTKDDQCRLQGSHQPVQVARRCAWHRSVPPLGSWGSADASHLELLEPQHRSHPEIPIGNPRKSPRTSLDSGHMKPENNQASKTFQNEENSSEFHEKIANQSWNDINMIFNY